MSTTVDLAPANTTPKVYSVPLTVADMNNSDYASGRPVFTPNAGDVVAFWWVTTTTPWSSALTVFLEDVGDSVNTSALADAGVVTLMVVAEGTEVRTFGAGDVFTAGAGALHVLVFPAP